MAKKRFGAEQIVTLRGQHSCQSFRSMLAAGARWRKNSAPLAKRSARRIGSEYWKTPTNGTGWRKGQRAERS
jgi:hypothetical protein